jgi:hypothetical protein
MDEKFAWNECSANPIARFDVGKAAGSRANNVSTVLVELGDPIKMGETVNTGEMDATSTDRMLYTVLTHSLSSCV